MGECTINPFSVAGKTILVVGASSGIGRATAISCSKMGADIILSARNKERLDVVLNSLEPGNHRVFVTDVTNIEQTQSFVEDLPILDGVVFSVGITTTSPVSYCSPEKFEHIFGVNFFGQVELFRVLLKKKKIKSGASIVFVSSVGGVELFNVGKSIYGASKAALHSFMKTSAKELAAKKIRVNSVNPGMVDTPLIHGGVISEEQLEKDVQNYPLKRYGEPEDIANGIIYLLSDASSWVTGHALVIDGGVTI